MAFTPWQQRLAEKDKFKCLQLTVHERKPAILDRRMSGLCNSNIYCRVAQPCTYIKQEGNQLSCHYGQLVCMSGSLLLQSYSSPPRCTCLWACIMQNRVGMRDKIWTEAAPLTKSSVLWRLTYITKHSHYCVVYSDKNNAYPFLEWYVTIVQAPPNLSPGAWSRVWWKPSAP